MQIIDYNTLRAHAYAMSQDIHRSGIVRPAQPLLVCPVPSGGIPAALALSQHMDIVLTDDHTHADIVVDDLIDTGNTMARYNGTPFFALIDKRTWQHGNDWVVWPWEQTAEKGIADHITRLLQFIGEDPLRGGLIETPERVAKAWTEWSSGYKMDPASILKMFEDGATDEMVVERNIPFFSHCEHHMAPFFGKITIGYVPNGKVVGLSKMNRLVECFSRRLQVQERLTQQIADAMFEHLGAHGVGVRVTAQHMCVMSRGIKHAGCDTVTSAVRGCFTERDTRAEFMALSQ